ncbi:subtilisin-like protease SBT5.3 [Tripterygium wilfordii]|uniref:subtilisin-like protease SBT5.3 n=1 Tax=Tripterygium wilfordii TaxID=458696 RepID=UPI0018F807B1|nr:subtilisin-like protease SBT5.3 [Tripterygium wilfordii]
MGANHKLEWCLAPSGTLIGAMLGGCQTVTFCCKWMSVLQREPTNQVPREEMRISILSSFLQLIFVFSLLTQILAIKKAYVVYLGSHVHGSEPTSMDIDAAKASHYNLLGSLMGSTEKAKNAIFIQYTLNINGFGAMLEEEEAAEIAKHPDVVSVFLNKKNYLFTTKSWDFLGLENGKIIPDGSIWKKARFGEDTIIGNIDTGVWPESKSFSDEGYGPVPSRWKGQCQEDKTENPVRCNRKLIGTRVFNKLGEADSSARDQSGHGTHTLSTAAGNFVPGLHVYNQPNGTAKGGSPRARVVAYKACDSQGCNDVDILAAFDAAISDGADVLSVSLGRAEPVSFFEEGISIGALHAVAKGMVVVASAGNNGLEEGKVGNASPWIFTVAASTIDRDLSNGSKSFVRAPAMADFSSTGPNEFEPALLKPDITAPGVDIIAAYSEDPEAYEEGKPVPFKALSGTSMSCPHVSGIVGLLKTLYPQWTPAAIRSAIMTTATTADNTNQFIQNPFFKKATPFNYGAGHVQPNLAADPGLVYDLQINDYLNFICAHGYNESFIRKIYGKPYACPKSISIANFNYPSITVPDLESSITITRRVKNVGSPGTYRATIEAANGLSISVTPTILVFDAIGQEKSFSVTLESKIKNEPKEYVFGNLVWSDGKHNVRSPLVVKHA